MKVPPGPAGLARVEVKFLIDANGILQVAARDLRTSQERSIEVQPSYGLNDTEVERMLEESIEFAEQDFSERQLIEARNEGEIILHATVKTLSEQSGAPISVDERRTIDQAIANLRAATVGSDYKLVRTRIDELNEATMHLAEVVMNSALHTALEGKRIEDV